MLYIDIKYLKLMNLEGFSVSAKNVYNFRCPVCGDSKKNKFKKRGGAIVNDKDKSKLYIHCFNCEYGSSFSYFLFTQNKALFKQYKRELLENDFSSKSNIRPVEKKIKKVTPKHNILGKSFINICKLGDDHKAKVYLKYRCIDKKYWREIYYVQNFKKWFNDNYKQNTYKVTKNNDERIVFPIYNKDKKLIGFQGRSLDIKNEVRYLTVKLHENETLVYGMDNIDIKNPVYLTEGILDSLMLDNSIAMLKSNINFEFVNNNLPKNSVFVFDQEYRNKQIKDNYMKVAKMKDYGLFFYPKKMKEKDLNLFIQNNPKMYPMGIMKMIKDNTYYGMKKRIKLISK